MVSSIEPTPIRQYHVFLASPGDVNDERQRFVNSSNATTGTRHNCGEYGWRSSIGRTMPPLVLAGHRS